MAKYLLLRAASRACSPGGRRRSPAKQRFQLLGKGVVPRKGLEPSRPLSHWHLKPARLPIPPPGHVAGLVRIGHALVKSLRCHPNALYSEAVLAYRESAKCHRYLSNLTAGIDPMTSNLETLVTVFGGSGVLGRNVVRALAKREYRIRVPAQLIWPMAPLLGTVGESGGRPAL